MPITRRALALGAAFAAGLLCGPAGAADPVKIRVAYSSLPAQMIPALFQLKEPLKHQGKSYVVEPVGFQGSTNQITALAAKEIDMALFSPAALVLAIVNARLDVRIIADNAQDGKEGYYSQTFYVRNDNKINTVEDLKGKRIGSNAVGSASDTMLRAMLRKHKMDENRDVQIIEVSFANQLPMIDDGKIDATTIPIPMAYDLVKSGKYKPLFSSREAIGTTQFGCMTARTDFLAANKAAVMDFMEDYVRAMRWYMDPKNREEGLPIVARVSKRQVADVSHMFTGLDYYRDPYSMPNVEGIQLAIDVAYDLKLLPTKLDATKYLDLSFVEEAKRRITANP